VLPNAARDDYFFMQFMTLIKREERKEELHIKTIKITIVGVNHIKNVIQLLYLDF
jgi:hypothetical protein